MSSNLQHDPIGRGHDVAQRPPERYRSVSAWAVGSVICGVLSALTAFDWVVALIPMLGVFLGLGALQRIDRAPEELTGVRVAKAGMILSAVFWILGYGWLTYLFFADTPPGYHRITYALLQPDPADKTGQPPPAARELEGKRVFVKGYMNPGRQNAGFSQFVLVPVDDTCPYCVPNPKETEMIQVKLIHGIKGRFTSRLVGVGGEFHIRSEDDEEKGLLYQIRADYLR
ncbi:MAG: DUF3299 domain-containing protein [Planctomycetota bacterium]